MSNVERLQAPSSAELPADAPAKKPAGAALSPLVEYLLLFALFAGWIGFWGSVVWWLVK
jgi:hypothetical protein